MPSNAEWKRELSQIRSYVSVLEKALNEHVSLEKDGPRAFANACAQMAGQIIHSEAPHSQTPKIVHLVCLVVTVAAIGNDDNLLAKFHIEQLEYLLGVYKDAGALKAEFMEMLSSIWDHADNSEYKSE